MAAPDLPTPRTWRAHLIHVPRLAKRTVLGLAMFLVLGNLVILGAMVAARAVAASPPAELAGVQNYRVVDARVVRGDAPTREGYRSLAEIGVTTIVDLRAERDLHIPDGLLEGLGIERVHLPIRDGQTPTTDQVQAFLDTVDEADGLVYLHCGAGVGRTGAMAAAYLVLTGQRSGGRALAANLSVGPPSLEQILYAASLDAGHAPDQPPEAIKVVSRVLDGPRRIWSRIN